MAEARSLDMWAMAGYELRPCINGRKGARWPLGAIWRPVTLQRRRRRRLTLCQLEGRGYCGAICHEVLEDRACPSSRGQHAPKRLEFLALAKLAQVLPRLFGTLLSSCGASHHDPGCLPRLSAAVSWVPPVPPPVCRCFRPPPPRRAQPAFFSSLIHRWRHCGGRGSAGARLAGAGKQKPPCRAPGPVVLPKTKQYLPVHLQQPESGAVCRP